MYDVFFSLSLSLHENRFHNNTTNNNSTLIQKHPVETNPFLLPPLISQSEPVCYSCPRLGRAGKHKTCAFYFLLVSLNLFNVSFLGIRFRLRPFQFKYVSVQGRKKKAAAASAWLLFLSLSNKLDSDCRWISLVRASLDLLCTTNTKKSPVTVNSFYCCFLSLLCSPWLSAL